MDSPDPYRLDFEKSPLENGHPRGGGDGQSSGLQSSSYSSGPSDEPEGDAAEGVGEDIGARLRSIFGDAAEVSDGDEDAEGAATFGAAVREAKRSKVDGVGLPVGRVAAQRSEAAGPSAGGLPSQPASGRAAQAARQRPQPSRSGQVGVPPAQAGVGAQPLSGAQQVSLMTASPSAQMSSASVAGPAAQCGALTGASAQAAQDWGDALFHAWQAAGWTAGYAAVAGGQPSEAAFAAVAGGQPSEVGFAAVAGGQPSEAGFAAVAGGRLLQQGKRSFPML